MRDIKWLVNRLKSMNVPEVTWRVQQKVLQRKEYKQFYLIDMPVTEIPLSSELQNLALDESRLEIHWDNQHTTIFENLELLGDYKYSDYKKNWNAGFQTDNVWDEKTFSYHISTSQREDIGDIRTNWELNRHFQFACISKNFYLTGDDKYLRELKYLFTNWNEHNHFLHGVEWASAMEIAIRVNSWIYTYVFLKRAFEKYSVEDQVFLDELSHGILVMTTYIKAHRSRFSSANNHLIVEMYALGLVGIMFSYQPWIEYATKVLTKELPKQNNIDGVNKEMSLHYQAFVMEAYGLLWLSMKKNNISVPSEWARYLRKMSEYVADCCGDYGEVIVFGDNDEGKILDLCGNKFNYFHYVLHLTGDLLETQYTSYDRQETIDWISKGKKTNIYYSSRLRVYPDSGMIILRSRDRKVLIAMDCGNLGFGSIAAHGHADALSVQVYFEGRPILVDSGTYSYHVPKRYRDEMRSTKSHNTVVVKGFEQAEMLGPFLWGTKYKKSPLKIKFEDENVDISCEISYKGIKHKRTLTFDSKRKISISDSLNVDEGYQCWNILAPCEKNRGSLIGCDFDINTNSKRFITEKSVCSIEYGRLLKSKRYLNPIEKRRAVAEIILHEK